MKNAHIELCRFIGAIIILCHHTYLFENRTYFVTGWLFVEFYFMLTGYFTAMHFLRPHILEIIYIKMHLSICLIKFIVFYLMLGVA